MARRPVARVGIVTPYDGSLASRRAVRLAEGLREIGAVVHVVARGRIGRVRDEWDRRVLSARRRPWVELLAERGCTAVVWTTPATQVHTYLAVAFGMQSILLADDALLGGDNGDLLAGFAAIVCSTARLARELRARWRLPGVIHVPWAPAFLPTCRQPVRALRLLLPLPRGLARRELRAIRQAAAAILAAVPAATLTVACASSATQTVRRVLAGLPDGRVRLSGGWREDEPDLFFEHDVLVWASCRGGAEAAAAALACGVPVVTCKRAAAAEYVDGLEDGVLAEAADDPAALAGAVQALLTRAASDRWDTAAAIQRASERAARWTAAWAAILTGCRR